MYRLFMKLYGAETEDKVTEQRNANERKIFHENTNAN